MLDTLEYFIRVMTEDIIKKCKNSTYLEKKK